jgi:VanZ family protein
LIFAVITEGIQLFVVSGSPSIVDIIIKSFGLTVGILASLFAKKDYQIYFGYAFILLLYFLYPFQLDLLGIKTKLDIGSLIPFRMQLAATNTNIFNDFIHTWLLFLPAGFSLCIKRSKLGYRPIGLPRLFLTGMLIGFVIEIMQIFINSRTAEITDTLYAGLGCLSGGYLCKMALELQKLHPTH